MSQGFKLKFDEMRDNDPSGSSMPRSKTSEEFYSEESHARNICFVWLDGKRMFLNYSYLVSGEYEPDENTIALTFTSQTLVLKGINLEGLFYNIMHHLTKQITCADARYNEIKEDDKFVVNEIQIGKRINS